MHCRGLSVNYIVNDSLLASDSGKVSLLTLLDLFSAFDTIDHTILLTRLEYTFGIHNTALAWFKSYLYDRFQTVSVNNMQFDPVRLFSGIPQGSVLGPVLFTLYATRLASIINRHSLNHHLYAAETQLLNSVLPENIHTPLKTTSDWYSDITNWTTQSKLQVNSEKTEAMLINTLQLDDTTVPLSDCQKPRLSPRQHTIHGELHLSNRQIRYYQFRRISSAWKYLSTEATVKLPWSPGSFCQALTTAVLSFLACLLPLSKAFVAYKTVLLASY